MAGTPRTLAQLFTLFADNATKDITAQDGRDLCRSAMGWTDSRDPNENDDNAGNSSSGGFFDVGSTWINFTAGSIWFCVDGSATAAVWVKACCNIFPVGVQVPNLNPAVKGFFLRAANAQTADLLDITTYTGAHLSRMLPTGSVIQIPNDDIGRIQKLIDTLTTKDFDQWQDSLGTVLASMSHLGELAVAGLIIGVKTVTSSYTVTRSDSVILVDATSTNCTITVPLLSGVHTGRVVWVKRIDASGHTVSVIPSGGNHLDGATTLSIATQYAGLTFVSNESAGQWRVIGNFPPAGTVLGTVTSVGLTVPAALLTQTGSPITSAGTLAISLATQAAKKVFAGPASGADAAPTFRVLGAGDLPTITQVTTALALDYTTIAAAGPGGSVMVPLISPLGAGYVPVAVGLWFTGGALFAGPGITGVFFRFYVGANGPLGNWNVNFAALTSGAVFSALGGVSNLLDAGDAFSVQVSTTGAGVEALNAGHCTVFLVSSKVS